MKKVTHFLKLRTPSFLSNHRSLVPIRHYTSCSETSKMTTTRNQKQELTPEELKQVNLLLPRLCESDHLHEAIRLVDTVLLANPPLNSISLPILIDRLSQQPCMTHSMSLLNRLKHNPNTSHSLLHISKLLTASYLRKKRFKEAMKILNWMWRPDSPCAVDAVLYGVVVKGLCRNYRTVEALGVVKKMVEEKVVVGGELRDWVYRSLLREARIREAMELNEALGCDLVGDEEQLQRVVGLLDRIMCEWAYLHTV